VVIDGQGHGRAMKCRAIAGYRFVALMATTAAQTIQFRRGLQVEWSNLEQYRRRYEVGVAMVASLISRVQS
jgi:hypothetical protein